MKTGRREIAVHEWRSDVDVVAIAISHHLGPQDRIEVAQAVSSVPDRGLDAELDRVCCADHRTVLLRTDRYSRRCAAMLLAVEAVLVDEVRLRTSKLPIHGPSYPAKVLHARAQQWEEPGTCGSSPRQPAPTRNPSEVRSRLNDPQRVADHPFDLGPSGHRLWCGVHHQRSILMIDTVIRGLPFSRFWNM